MTRITLTCPDGCGGIADAEAVVSDGSPVRGPDGEVLYTPEPGEVLSFSWIQCRENPEHWQVS